MTDSTSSMQLRGERRANEPMARHLSWRAGGRAASCYQPADVDDLAAFLRSLPPDEPLLFVGLGSNLLVRDGGFTGTVILTAHPKRRPAMVDGGLYVEASVPSPQVARFALQHGLRGAEFLSGIPGCFGGALAMNAGCFGGETWERIESAWTVDRQGAIRVRERRAFEIDYRHCGIAGASDRLGTEEWFIAARLVLERGDTGEGESRIRDYLARRAATQPLDLPNAGSVFRNPPCDHAARLIEACGLKGTAIGGARVSEKHANFIVNPRGQGTATDIECLIERVRDRVRERTGVELIPEVRIVGERR